MSEYLAHIKYQGELVEDGFLDARKSAEILIGIDEVIRFFLFQENKESAKLNLEIPIRVKKGCWMAILPSYLLTTLSGFVAAYEMTALHTIAKNDFKDVTSKDRCNFKRYRKENC